MKTTTNIILSIRLQSLNTRENRFETEDFYLPITALDMGFIKKKKKIEYRENVFRTRTKNS